MQLKRFFLEKCALFGEIVDIKKARFRAFY